MRDAARLPAGYTAGWTLRHGKGTDAPAPDPPIQRVSSAAFSLDNARLLVGYTAIRERFYPADSLLGLWDARDGKFIRRFPGHQKEDVSWVAFIPPEETRALSASKRDGTIKLWNLECPGEAIRSFDAPESIISIALTPDEKQVLTGHEDGRIRVFDIATGRIVRTLSGIAPATVMTFLGGGKGLLVGCGNGALQYWDLTTGRLVREFLEPGMTPHRVPNVISVTPSPDERLVIVRRRGGKDDPEGVRVWNLSTGDKVWSLRSNDFQSDPTFFPDGGLLVVEGGVPSGDDMPAGHESGQRRLVLREIQSGRVVRNFDERPGEGLGASGFAAFLAFTRNGKQVRSIDTDGTARIWDVAGGQQIWSKRMDWGGSRVVSQDGTLAFTPANVQQGPGSTRAKIWDLVEGKLRLVLDWPK